MAGALKEVEIRAKVEGVIREIECRSQSASGNEEHASRFVRANAESFPEVDPQHPGREGLEPRVSWAMVPPSEHPLD